MSANKLQISLRKRLFVKICIGTIVLLAILNFIRTEKTMHITKSSMKGVFWPSIRNMILTLFGLIESSKTTIKTIIIYLTSNGTIQNAYNVIVNARTILHQFWSANFDWNQLFNTTNIGCINKIPTADQLKEYDQEFIISLAGILLSVFIILLNGLKKSFMLVLLLWSMKMVLPSVELLLMEQIFGNKVLLDLLKVRCLFELFIF